MTYSTQRYHFNPLYVETNDTNYGMMIVYGILIIAILYLIYLFIKNFSNDSKDEGFKCQPKVYNPQGLYDMKCRKEPRSGYSGIVQKNGSCQDVNYDAQNETYYRYENNYFKNNSQKITPPPIIVDRPIVINDNSDYHEPDGNDIEEHFDNYTNYSIFEGNNDADIDTNADEIEQMTNISNVSNNNGSTSPTPMEQMMTSLSPIVALMPSSTSTTSTSPSTSTSPIPTPSPAQAPAPSPTSTATSAGYYPLQGQQTTLTTSPGTTMNVNVTNEEIKSPFFSASGEMVVGRGEQGMHNANLPSAHNDDILFSCDTVKQQSTLSAANKCDILEKSLRNLVQTGMMSKNESQKMWENVAPVCNNNNKYKQNN